MSDLVPPEVIESAVGRKRHATEHWGRWNTSENRIYILHSQECKDSGIDLRECKYSRALDKGPRCFDISDTAVKLAINSNGRLIPA